MNTLAAYRERLAAQHNKTTSTNSTSPYFAFWKLDTGQSATIRFLPDTDPDSLFWVERQMINLPFAGVVNKPEAGKVTVAVPCLKMYDEKCPIIEDTRPLWETNKDLARLYYAKRTFMFQGLVVKSDLVENNAPESPIRLFSITPSIFKIINEALLDPDLENMPCDVKTGRDFRIKKGTQGEFANYGTSSFAAKERALSEAELAQIGDLQPLSRLLPPKPDEARQALIWEAYQSSLRSEEFDPEKFEGLFYRTDNNTALAEDYQ